MTLDELQALQYLRLLAEPSAPVLAIEFKHEISERLVREGYVRVG